MFETTSVSAVPRYKAHMRGPKVAATPMSKLVNCNRESSLKLDGDSKGFSVDASIATYGPLDRLAECGIVPLIPKVVVIKRG